MDDVADDDDEMVVEDESSPVEVMGCAPPFASED